jgi:hypothetical protein
MSLPVLVCQAAQLQMGTDCCVGQRVFHTTLYASLMCMIVQCRPYAIECTQCSMPRYFY